MDYAVFFTYLAACVAPAMTGALFPPGDWYRAMRKPAWTPPNWAFPVAWTTLYLLMSAAAARAAGVEGAEAGLALWSVQIAFNTLWTPVFFGLRRMKLALGVLGALWLAVAATMVAFFRVDVWAGTMFLPYLAWVSVAFALNLSVVRLNPGLAAGAAATSTAAD